MKVAFLGMGAMGSRMADALLDAGYELTIWNRTRSKVDALCAKGASLAANPKQAAEGADFVFSMVRDDEASMSVWLDESTGAINGLSQNAIAVECSTLSVDWARELSDVFKKHSKKLVFAPLAGSRPQADARKLIFFVSGDALAVELVRPVLECMGSTVHPCGGGYEASAVKLMVNALFGSQVAIMAELITFAQKMNVDSQRAIEIMSSTPVCSPAAALAAKAMLDGQFAAAFPIELVAKDFDMFARSAGTVGFKAPAIEQVGQVYTRAADSGLSDFNITGIIKLHSSRS